MGGNQKQKSGSNSALGTALAVMRTATDPPAMPVMRLVAQGIGNTIKTTRELQQISLSDLAKRAGVSKSVVSRIGGGLTSPTAVMPAKLAEGMTVSLSSPSRSDMGPPVHIQQAAEQPIFRTRRADWCGVRSHRLAPMHWSKLCTIVCRQERRPDTSPRTRRGLRNMVVLSGKIDVTVGKREFKLAAGDAAQFSADVEHAIHNPGPRRAEWLLVIHSPLVL